MRTSTVATLSLGLLTVGAALLTLNNYQRASQHVPTAETRQLPRYTLRDAHWTRLDAEGAPQYVAQAQSIEYYDDESARLRQPHVSAFGGSSSPWTLQAPAGSTPANSRDLRLEGGVRVHGYWADGRELNVTTPHLWLDNQQRLLRTDAEVKLESVGRQLQARGLAADADGSRIRLLDQVRGVYSADPASAGMPAADTATDKVAGS